MVIEHLTEQELDMIDSYRNAYVDEDVSYESTESMGSISFILREWNRVKDNLFKLLGNKLIISKSIEYEKSFDQLQDEVYQLRDGNFGRIGRSGEKFYSNFMQFIRNTFPVSYSWDDDKGMGNDEINSGLWTLMGDESLVTNKYSGKTFSIPLSNGKTYKVANGCKVSKALGKIAEYFNIEGYEDFRICHSQILNQKRLTGILNLSIHPMDYMTMSDNECGWDSCMNWRNVGCYRQGTVEMMNSPTVLVAYLTSDQDMQVPSGREHYKWNSKKWRQLFIADKTLLVSVKDYPYHNDDLNCMVMDWIKELAESNLGWKYEDKITKFDYNSKTYIPCIDKNVKIDFETYNMYNDFGTLDYHWMYLSKDPTDFEKIREGAFSYHLDTVPYSGSSECMICGDLTPDVSFNSEEDLACYNCHGYKTCDYCGDAYCGVTFEVDGEYICEYCYENNVHKCAVTEEEHLENRMRSIYVIPNISEEKMADIRKNQHDFNSDSKYIYCKNHPQFWVNKDQIKKFEKKFLLPGRKLHLITVQWADLYCVYFDDLTKKGLKFSDTILHHDNEGYYDSFEKSYYCPMKISQDTEI